MAQLKSTSVTGNLSVTGNILASKIIKLGGTEDDILMGDGSTTSKQGLIDSLEAAMEGNSWRPIKYGSTTVNDTSTTLEFVAGSNIGLTFTNGQLTIANNYSYSLPLATNSDRGGVKIGNSRTLDPSSEINAYTSTTGRNYLIELNSANEQLFVNVPWTNTTYSFTGGTNKFTVTPSSGDAFDVSVTPSITNNITGSGTANYIPKFTAANTLGNSEIIDNGSNVYPSANLGNALGHADYNWDKVFTRQVELNRVKGITYGRINFYSPSYYTWYEYMSNPGVASPTGANTATHGGVTSWARRSLIESSAGYGWIWESCANSANASPTPRMSLSSNTGVLTVSGDVSTPGLAITSSAVQKAKWKYNSADDCIELEWS